MAEYSAPTRGNKQLEVENDIFKRAARVLRSGERPPKLIYSLVRELADDDIPVALGRPEPPRELRNEELTKMIREIHAESRGSYGSPRVHES